MVTNVSPENIDMKWSNYAATNY